MSIFHRPGRWMVLLVWTALCLGTTSSAHAKQAIVTMKDGRQIQGRLVEQTDQSVVIDILGIQTTLPRADIARITFQATLADEYQRRKAQLKPDDTGQWYSLARWLYGQNSTEGDQLARKELLALLQQHPDHQEARLLLNLTERRIAQRAGSSQPSPTPTPTPTPTPRPAPSVKDWPMMDVKQVRLLKIYEVDLGTRPNVIVPEGTIQQFFKVYRTHKVLEPYQGTMGLRKFKALPGYEQLAVLFEARARSLYDQIIIRDEPRSLKTFRSLVNPRYVVGYCGSCHGKPTISKFYVFTSRANTEPSAYSNLMILNKYPAPQGRLIDYADPNKSLLIQFGLPPREAITPHPKTTGYRPYFTGLKDPRINMLLDWITKDLNRVTPPDYPIEYNIPLKGPLAEPPQSPAGSGSTTPPATPPAPNPKPQAAPTGSAPATDSTPAPR